MEITEVRVKLVESKQDKLKAFCSITIDDAFVVRDLKIIEGAKGLFVAMPSRKLTARCNKCGCKNPMRSNFCCDCGYSMPPDRRARDGRQKMHADIAHPINSECRETIQSRVLESYEVEHEASLQPGYQPASFDDDYETLDDSDFGTPITPETAAPSDDGMTDSDLRASRDLTASGATGDDASDSRDRRPRRGRGSRRSGGREESPRRHDRAASDGADGSDGSDGSKGSLRDSSTRGAPPRQTSSRQSPLRERDAREASPRPGAPREDEAPRNTPSRESGSLREPSPRQGSRRDVTPPPRHRDSDRAPETHGRGDSAAPRKSESSRESRKPWDLRPWETAEEESSSRTRGESPARNPKKSVEPDDPPPDDNFGAGIF